MSAAPILMITRRLTVPRSADAKLVLPFETRSRSRIRTRLTDGAEVGIVLERGQILRGGDLLLADDGRAVLIEAAAEAVTTLRSRLPSDLARAAYHLGNRHVALQVGDYWLRYSRDHVLDDMARGLGLEVIYEDAAFEPEAGAYHSHGAAMGVEAGGARHAHGEHADSD